MPLAAFDQLACPLDGVPLAQDGQSWRCASGHSFDIARQGYVHLLPVQKKRSREPGDSKEMVAARRRFLETGGYEPVSDAVNRVVTAGLAVQPVWRILDAGSGEGYYTGRLAEALSGQTELQVLGLDISKWAVQSAAKRYKDLSWVVASNANLPVLPEAVDAVLSLFGFPVYGEFARVLKPGGLLLQVDTGPDHLRELREIIYPELKPARADQSTWPEGFRSLGAESVRYPLTVEGQDRISDLLAMTPHGYRASEDGRRRAAELTGLTVTVDVTIRTFEKH